MHFFIWAYVLATMLNESKDKLDWLSNISKNKVLSNFFD